MSADQPGNTGPNDDPVTPVGTPTSTRRARGPKRTPRPTNAAGWPVGTLDGAIPGVTSAKVEGNGSTSQASATIVAPDRSPTPQGDGDDTAVTSALRPGFFEPISTAPRPSTATPIPPAEPRPTGRRGRRVKRVIRRIELWSVLKLALVLYSCLYGAVLVTLALAWGLAYSSGQVQNLQNFLADVGLENYRFYGDQMFRACAAIGAVAVLAGTVITVLTAALVNVISEVTGGIRLVVIEEDAGPPR